MTQSRITAILTVAGMLAAMWVFEILDFLLFGGTLDHRYGLSSWDLGEPWTVLTAPFMHGNFQHLIGNSLPFLVLGSLVAFSGLSRFLITTLIVTVVSGVGVWFFTAPPSITVGASGLVFGYFGYTVLRGIIERKTIDIVIMICVVLFYGTMIWGVLPQYPGVSWQAHLFGFLGGLLAAYLLPKRERRRPIEQWKPGAQGGYHAP
ncbi:rhomboid family intramembrane serine protease [Nocardiopsis sp. N85]|uniref:rhomboid family intramembrane serine protease n=1 Tax=Nocardiopsis sp. N85 TaxID=3029400 RepID=UPI00237F7C8A|nr:rhomboid family intramembrane serine protease [Nocardiopsis sp. N85]MDE3724901.1 rhomboid family intramembrane serine protease [Nocardiopsis sp. N85]